MSTTTSNKHINPDSTYLFTGGGAASDSERKTVSVEQAGRILGISRGGAYARAKEADPTHVDMGIDDHVRLLSDRGPSSCLEATDRPLQIISLVYTLLDCCAGLP